MTGRGVRAQEVALPEVVVTSPSPIVRSPAPGPAAPAGVSSLFQPGLLQVPENVFAPVTVVPRDEIERSRPATLGEALFDKPGLSASTFAPGASRPIIRGLDSVRVRVQENGIGVHDVSDLGEDHAVPINPLVNDRIEVIRGPATLRYGSQAIGGVVSAENNRIPTFIPPNNITGRITTGLSSVDAGRDAAASVDAGYGNVAYHADAFSRVSADYWTPFGRQRNSAMEAEGGAFGTSYVFDRGFAGLAVEHFQSLYRIPGGEQAQTRTRLDPTQDKIASKGEYRPEAGPFQAIRYWLGASNYEHHEIGLGDDGDRVRATFKNREIEGRVEAQHVPVTTDLGTLTGAVGVQTGRRKLGTSGDANSLLPPTDTRNLAGYVFEELALTDNTKLQAAGRIERSRLTGIATQFPSGFLPSVNGPDAGPPDANAPDPGTATGASADELTEAARRRLFTASSGSFGLLQKLPWGGVVATLTGQYVERAPSAPELYSRGPHDAPGTFEIGDANLKKERARTLEAGLRRGEGPFRFDLTAYYTRYTGFIYRRLTGNRCGDTFESCGVDDTYAQIVYSQQNATFFGAEFSTQLDLIPVRTGFIGIDTQQDFVRAYFDDHTNVPRIPPFRIGGGVFWRDEGFFARVGLLHAYAHRDVAPIEGPTPGYNLLKAELSYTQKLDPKAHGFTDLTIGAVGTNLLNDDVRNSTSFKKNEVLLPGRSLRLFTTVRF